MTVNYYDNGGIIGPVNDPQKTAETITTFTASGTFNPVAPNAEVLIIGGGGGGGPNRGAGGGAGGVLYTTNYTLPGSPVTVTIGGAGGGGGTGSQNFPGSNGGATVFDGISANGGGFGSGHHGNGTGGPGGSGGGAGIPGPGVAGTATQTPVGVFTGYGNDGGPGGDPGGGGGGAGTTASPRSTGGAGIQFDIESPTASPVQLYYASGGGGGNGSGPPTAGGGSNPQPSAMGGGGGSHGPVRNSYSGQAGYVAIKEPEVFLGAPGVWRLNEVYELVKANNWSTN